MSFVYVLIQIFLCIQCTEYVSDCEQVSPERSTAEVANNSKSDPITVVAAKPKRDTKKESMEAKRERKAAKTLAVITGECCIREHLSVELLETIHACYFQEFNVDHAEYYSDSDLSLF